MIAGAVLRREALRLLRRPSQLLHPPLFVSLVAVLFPLALGTNEALLQATAPAVIWIATLLATTLSLDDIFRSDWEDGSVELLVSAAPTLSVACAMKGLAHWLLALLPVIAMALLLTMLYDIPSVPRTTLIQTLLLGTPVFSFIGTIGSALTVGVRAGALLLALLVIPFYLPVLIFGASAVHNAGLGLSVASEQYMLAGLSVLAITLAPTAAAAGLRARLN